MPGLFFSEGNQKRSWIKSGFFMEIDMPTCVLAERSADLNQDISHVSESFAGMMIGEPSVDLGPA